MMRPLRCLGLLSVCLLAVLLFLAPAQGQAQSDDDDYVPSSPGDTQRGRSGLTVTGGVEAEVLRIAVMNVRPTFEAERRVPQSERERINKALFNTSEEINFANRTIMHSDFVSRHLGPREQEQYMRCWLNPTCLQDALAQAKLDLAVVGNLRLTEIDRSQLGADGAAPDPTGSFFDEPQQEELFFAEYTLFIRIIDMRRGRVIRELLVTHTDVSRLAGMGAAAYRDALVQLGFITDRPLHDVARISDDGQEVGVAATPRLEDIIKPEPVRNRGMKIAAWTTLGLGLTAEALGLTFGALSSKAQRDAERARTPAAMISSDSDRRTYMITSNVMYGTGGALLITSVVLFVLGYSGDDVVGSGGGAPEPLPALTGGGLGLLPEGGMLFQAQGRF